MEEAFTEKKSRYNKTFLQENIISRKLHVDINTQTLKVKTQQTFHDEFDVSLCDLSKCCFRPSLAETGVSKFSATFRHTTLSM
jgi:hypothetical protein